MLCGSNQDNMLRGGSALSGMTGGGTAVQAMNPGSAEPSRAGDIDSRLLSPFDMSALKSNSSVAKVDYVIQQPVSDPTVNSTLRYIVQPSNSPGVMFDLSKSHLHIKYTGQSAGISWLQQWDTTAFLFSRIGVKINGVPVDNQVSNGAQHFCDATDRQLKYPYADPGFMGASDVYSVDQQRLWEESGIVSVATPRANHPCQTAWKKTRRWNAIFNRGYAGGFGSGELVCRWAHPFWNDQNQALVPGSMSIELQCDKWGGNNFPYSINNLAGNPAFAFANLQFELRMCRVQLSGAGNALYRQLVQESGLMRYRGTRYVAQQFALALGATSHTGQIFSTKKPSAVCIWFNETTTQQPLINTSALMCERGSVGGVETPGLGHIAQILSLRVHAGPNTYPKYAEQAISRVNTGRFAHGGSSKLDYEQYAKMCQQYQNTDNEVQPLMTQSFFESGAYENFYINLREDNEPVFDIANETEAGDISIESQFHQPLAASVTMTVLNIYEETVYINPALGIVKTSW